jgi:hypothetical protein
VESAPWRSALRTDCGITGAEINARDPKLSFDPATIKIN